MRKVLIDTDVILDFFFDRKPHSEYSTIVLSYCEKNIIEAYITPVMISNIYYLLKRTAKHQKVIEKIKQLLSFINVLTMDRSVIEKALNSEFKDFEDALQNFAATNYGEINSIITRNVKDYKKSSLGVITPEDFVKLLNAEH